MSDADIVIRAARTGATIELIIEVFKILIEKNVLTQGEAIQRIDAISMAFMKAKSLGEAVALIDIVRDAVAGENERKPS